jgi:hypothetical protein
MGNEIEDLILIEHAPNREFKSKMSQSKLSTFLCTVIVYLINTHYYSLSTLNAKILYSYGSIPS